MRTAIATDKIIRVTFFPETLCINLEFKDDKIRCLHSNIPAGEGDCYRVSGSDVFNRAQIFIQLLGDENVSKYFDSDEAALERYEQLYSTINLIEI